MGAGTASADSGYDNYQYLQGLNNNGIYVYNTNQAINYGRSICSRLSYGYSAYDEQERVFYSTPELSLNGAYNYVGVATAYYCPQFSYRVNAPVSY